METLGGALWALATKEEPIDRSATMLSRWTGAAWETVGTDTIYGWHIEIRDMHAHAGEIYIAGHLVAGEYPNSCSGVARWGDARWEGLGAGVSEAYALASYDGSLVVAGRFSSAGGVAASSVASWDGSDWHPLGAGLTRYEEEGTSATVQGLVFAGNRLIATGNFRYSGTEEVRYVGAWDGSAWTVVGEFPEDHSYSHSPTTLAYWKGLVVLGKVYRLDEQYRPIGALAAWDTSPEGDASWRTIGGIGVHPASAVKDFAVTGEGLVVAAEFFDPDRARSVDAVGLWNGTEWRLIGEPFNGEVLAVEEHRGRLYAGGHFTGVGGRSTSYVAQWDGTEWTGVGIGMSSRVLDLLSAGDCLVAGGYFSKADEKNVWYIASWDGEEWSALGNGLHSTAAPFPWDLEMYDGQVYACGPFIIAGEERADGMGRWNGEAWFGLYGGNVTYDAYYPEMVGMEPWNGGLAVAGEFETAGGEPSPLMAIWNGLDWNALPSPEGGRIDRLCAYDGCLVAGGPMVFGATEEDTSYVTLWDGRRWSKLRSGPRLARSHPFDPSRPVTAMAVWRGSLYIGGEFTEVGGKPSLGIARWNGATYTSPEASFHLALGPNPARSRATIHWFQDHPGPVSLKVYDIRGRRAASLIGETYPGGYQAFEWGLTDDDGDGLPPGVYFVRLETEQGARSKKVVIVR